MKQSMTEYCNHCLSLVGHLMTLSDRDCMKSMTGWLINMEQLAKWEFAEDTEILGENLPIAALYTTNPT
jgi:hypothetical protein